MKNEISIEDRVSATEKKVEDLLIPKTMYRLNEKAAEQFIHKKLWRIFVAGIAFFGILQAVSVYVITKIAVDKASSEAYAEAYSGAFGDAVESVSSAAVHAETARNSAEIAEKSLENLLESANAAILQSEELSKAANFQDNIEEIAAVIAKSVLTNEALLTAVLADAFPKGTIITNLLTSACPPTFKPAGDAGLNVQDNGWLQTQLKASGSYDSRNVSDKDAVLTRMDGLKVFACIKS